MFTITRFRRRIFGYLLATLAVDTWVYIACEIRSPGFLLSGSFFWGTILLFPAAVDQRRLISPRNYVFSLFLITIVLSPPILYANGSLLTGWIMMYNPSYWEYFDYSLFLWNLSFLAYVLGLLGRYRRTGRKLPKVEEAEPASNWMLYAGVVLMALGVVGLILGAGSLSSLLAIRGQRALALEIINVSGKGRYIVWYSCIPYGACLVWYYAFRRLRLGRFAAFLLLLLLYVPLVPFYSFTSGRATTIMPLIMLVALYYRYCYRIPLRWFVAAFVPLLGILGLWALYRQDGLDFSTDQTVARLGIQVLMDSFSRLDVSVAAIAGFHEGHLPLAWGKTLVAALTHPIPSWIIDLSQEGGTMAMAKAVFVDPAWDEPSGMATPLMVEGYLNFGLVGTVLFMFVLGYLTRKTDSLFDSNRILLVILGLALTFQLPFGTALQLIVAGAFWTVVFPYLVSWGIFRTMTRLLVFKPGKA